MATIGRELILWRQLANPHEHQMSVFRSDELHPAEPDTGLTADVIGENNLVSG